MSHQLALLYQILLLLLHFTTQEEQCDLLRQHCIGQQCEYCLPGSFPNRTFLGNNTSNKQCDPCAPGTFQASYTTTQQVSLSLLTMKHHETP